MSISNEPVSGKSHEYHIGTAASGIAALAFVCAVPAAIFWSADNANNKAEASSEAALAALAPVSDNQAKITAHLLHPRSPGEASLAVEKLEQIDGAAAIAAFQKDVEAGGLNQIGASVNKDVFIAQADAATRLAQQDIRLRSPAMTFLFTLAQKASHGDFRDYNTIATIAGYDAFKLGDVRTVTYLLENGSLPIQHDMGKAAGKAWAEALKGEMPPYKATYFREPTY